MCDICPSVLKSGKRAGQPCGRTHKRKTNKGGYHNGQYHCGTHYRIYRALTQAQPKLTPLERRDRPDGSVEHILPIIYPNQAVAAQEIMTYFKQGIRAISLNSEMQNGKSGTGKELCNLFGREFENYQISIIVTINDNEILNQTRREFSPYVHPSYIFGAPDLQCQEYLKLLTQTNPDCKILIIIDESHYGTDKGGTLYRFFDNADIGLDGCNLPPNIYLLTISATANAEIALLNNDTIFQYKRQVVLKPDIGYYGVTEMLQKNRIREGWELKNEEQWTNMEQLVTNYSDKNKYIIIRCHDKHRISKLRDIVMTKPHCRFISYDQHSTIKDINLILSIVPDHPTIIGIARKLSASKQLKSTNLRLVFDYSTGNISTTVQGLVGRCCGYDKCDHDVIIYANVKHASVYSVWARSGFLPIATPNDKHVTNGVSGNITDTWEKNTPLPINVESIYRQLKSLSMHNLYMSLEELFSQQYPDLFEQYPCPLSGNGLLKITQHSAVSTKTLWWDNIMNASQRGKKILGYPRSIANVSVSAGYQMFVNVESKTCYVCFTKKTDPRGNPKVSPLSGYNPS